MMEVLAAGLTREYGKSYSKRNLQYFPKPGDCELMRSQSDLDTFPEPFAFSGLGGKRALEAGGNVKVCRQRFLGRHSKNNRYGG